MEKARFEHMIRQSGLRHILTLSFQLRFVVCLQAGTRFQNDTLEFGRDEFESMDERMAQLHIDACISRLDRAAKTQQGVVVYSEPQRQTQQKIPIAATRMAVNYPAH